MDKMKCSIYSISHFTIFFWNHGSCFIFRSPLSKAFYSCMYIHLVVLHESKDMLYDLFSDKYLVTLLHCDLHIYLMGVCKSSFGAVNLISQAFELLSKMCKKGIYL